jgi:cytochrome c biogenesis protein ResB
MAELSYSRKLLKTLKSVKLAVSLLAVIAGVMIVATLLRNQMKAQRYVYHSWWFLSLLGLFCLNLVLCTAGRWSLKIRKLGTSITHTGVLVMVAGAIVGGIWGERGTLRMFPGQSSRVCFDDKQKVIKLPFEIHLDDFTVERYSTPREALIVHLPKKQIARAFPVKVGGQYEVEDVTVTILRYEPDFIVLSKGKYGSRSTAPRNPAIQVRVISDSQDDTQWLFQKFPGMHQDEEAEVRLDYSQIAAGGRIKDFKSKLRLTQNGKVVASKTIEVNKPLRYEGYAIYQSSYDRFHESWSGLEIAKDPGIILVYLGFILISAGILYALYVRPLLTKKGRANSDAQ